LEKPKRLPFNRQTHPTFRQRRPHLFNNADPERFFGEVDPSHRQNAPQQGRELIPRKWKRLTAHKKTRRLSTTSALILQLPYLLLSLAGTCILCWTPAARDAPCRIRISLKGRRHARWAALWMCRRGDFLKPDGIKSEKQPE
jgi:hypothetical protein